MIYYHYIINDNMLNTIRDLTKYRDPRKLQSLFFNLSLKALVLKRCFTD